MARSSLTPGFRFHPTDVELVMYYLKKKVMGKKITANVVAEVNIYDFSPWDLPDKSSLKSGDLEWFFFCPKSKKYSSGGRANRTTEIGFWKATGKDRKVKYNDRTVATIKTLIFHLGPAKDGQRTDWVMHEYRLEDELLANAGTVQDSYVLCKIFEKSGSGPKNGAQYGKPFNEEEWDDDVASCSGSLAILGQVGTSNITVHKQTGPAATSMTGPGSSMVTCSANEPTYTPDLKQKGPATEPSLPLVTHSANTLDFKLKGPAVPQFTQGLSATEPGSSSVTLSTNEMHANADVIYLEDIDQIMGVPEEAANVERAKTMAPEDDGCFDDLLNQIMGVPEEAANVERDKTMAPDDDGCFDDLLNLVDLPRVSLSAASLTFGLEVRFVLYPPSPDPSL